MPNEETPTTSATATETEKKEEQPQGSFHALKNLYRELSFKEFRELIRLTNRHLDTGTYGQLWASGFFFIPLTCITIIVTAALLIGLIFGTSNGLPTWIILTMSFTAISFAVREFISVRTLRTPYRIAIHTQLTSIGRCPFCAYQIIDHALDVNKNDDDDNHLTCPECGNTFNLTLTENNNHPRNKTEPGGPRPG